MALPPPTPAIETTVSGTTRRRTRMDHSRRQQRRRFHSSGGGNSNSRTVMIMMMTTMMLLLVVLSTTVRTCRAFSTITTTTTTHRRAAAVAVAKARTSMPPTTTTTTTRSSTTTTTMTTTTTNTIIKSASTTSTTALHMAGVRTRGLEQRKEGPTPTEGGMTLYLKAAADGTSVGDCPFAHYVRMVLEEKGLQYDLKPTAPDAKPEWLLEYYDGKMPALRHRKECYVESGVIADYVEYFFPEPTLTPPPSSATAAADDVLEGFFPAVAQFLKDTSNSDDTTDAVKTKLQQFEDHLGTVSDDSFLAGGDAFTLLDCRVVPQLYHLQVGLDGLDDKKDTTALNLAEDFPKLYAYMQRCFARPSFQASKYPEETVLWGWGNARRKN